MSAVAVDPTTLPGEIGMVERPRRRWLPFSAWHLVLMPIALVMVTPLWSMLATSFETLEQTRHFPPILWPGTFRVENYANTLRAAAFPTWFWNTTVVTVSVVASNVLLCSLAGYAFARIRFLGRGVVYLILLATLMVPLQVVLIPSFLVVKRLGLIDHLGAMIVPNLANVFGIFMLTQFFRTLPIELEEAARIDGTSRLGILFKIVLPLSMPALTTLAVIQFMWTWNDFLWPLVTLPFNEGAYTLQLGLATFQTGHQTEWNLLMAGNVMSMLPMLLLFLLAQRWFIRGIATTGLKG
jgi:multiple sugar transport system permease protein